MRFHFSPLVSWGARILWILTQVKRWAALKEEIQKKKMQLFLSKEDDDKWPRGELLETVLLFRKWKLTYEFDENSVVRIPAAYTLGNGFNDENGGDLVLYCSPRLLGEWQTFRGSLGHPV
jgi:hypothetical protein